MSPLTDPTVHITDSPSDETQAIAQPDPVPADAPLLGQLRERREELAKERSVMLEIPGYRGLLWCRYRPLEWNELQQIAERTERSKEPLRYLHAAADGLIRACEEFLVKDGEKPLTPLHEALGLGEDPVRYDDRLAEAFNIEAGRAREVLFALFANDLAVTAHYNELSEWMVDAGREDDEQ